MNYKIINNLSKNDNHSTRIKKLLIESIDIVVASPFLMSDFSTLLQEIDIREKKIHLITTLCPGSQEQLQKINSLNSLIESPAIKNNEVFFNISLNNKLHGKVYIFKNAKGEYISAIVSSANFTNSGLSKNHEWGVEIFDENEISNLEQSIIGSIEFHSIAFSILKDMLKVKNDFLKQQSYIESIEIDLELINLLPTPVYLDDLDPNVNYWLKPIGVSTNPITEDRLFNDAIYPLHFAKQPISVKPNDIIIAFGIGSTKILSLYRASSDYEHVTDKDIEEENWLERWPWFIKGENLTPYFGATWYQHNLLTGQLLQEFLKANPEGFITAVGGKTLGAIQFSADKVNLDFDFAKFIISKILSINKMIAES